MDMVLQYSWIQTRTKMKTYRTLVFNINFKLDRTQMPMNSTKPKVLFVQLINGQVDFTFMASQRFKWLTFMVTANNCQPKNPSVLLLIVTDVKVWQETVDEIRIQEMRDRRRGNLLFFIYLYLKKSNDYRLTD